MEVNYESLVIRASVPWQSVYREEVVERHTTDSREDIDFCLNHCPYASDECCNCLAGGKPEAKRGRPEKFDIERLAEMLRLKKTSAEICKELGMSRMTVSRYKKKLCGV